MNNSSRWIWFLIIFVVGSSVIGTFSFMLTILFGFPEQFSSLLTLPLIGVAIWLFYKQYSPLAWLVVGCGVWIAVSIFVLIGAFFRTEPNIPTAVESYFEERTDANESHSSSTSIFDFFIPDYLTALNDGDDKLDVDENRDIIYNANYYAENGRKQFTIIFPAVDIPGGEWAFESGELKISGAFNATFTASENLNWATVDEVDFKATDQTPTQRINAFMVVEIPQLPLEDSEVTFEATLNILTAGVDEETRQQQTLKRTAPILIVSDNYYMYQQEYTTWQRSRRLVESAWGFVLVASDIIAGGIGLVLYRRGAFASFTSGSLRFEVRQKSGLQQLGVEAFTLAKLDPAITYGAEQGVYLGRVEAQSPAGRSGLRSADIVQLVNGKEVNAPNQLGRAVSGKKRGDMVQMRVLRNGQLVDLVINF